MSKTASEKMDKEHKERWADPDRIAAITKRQSDHRQGLLREYLIHTWRKTSEWSIDINRFAKLLEEKPLAARAPSSPDDRWWVDVILDIYIDILLGTDAEKAVWDDGLDVDFVDCLYTIIEAQKVLQEAGSVYAKKVGEVLEYVVELSAAKNAS